MADKVKDMRSGEELHKSRRSANIAARNKLAEKHPEEFRELLRVELEARGFTMEPTPEEKAEARLREILNEYPDLGEKYHLGVTVPVVSSDEDSQ